jgi:hypothetical protein
MGCVAGFKFRLYASGRDDLGTRTFAEPNWQPGDTVALADQVFRVRDVVYLDEDDIRGLLQLEDRDAETPYSRGYGRVTDRSERWNPSVAAVAFHRYAQVGSRAIGGAFDGWDGD